jgi:hypothetical protein
VNSSGSFFIINLLLFRDIIHILRADIYMKRWKESRLIAVILEKTSSSFQAATGNKQELSIVSFFSLHFVSVRPESEKYPHWSRLLPNATCACPTTSKLQTQTDRQVVHTSLTLSQGFPNIGSPGLYDVSRCESQNIKSKRRRRKISRTSHTRLNGRVKFVHGIICL